MRVVAKHTMKKVSLTDRGTASLDKNVFTKNQIYKVNSAEETDYGVIYYVNDDSGNSCYMYAHECHLLGDSE